MKRLVPILIVLASMVGAAVFSCSGRDDVATPPDAPAIRGLIGGTPGGGFIPPTRYGGGGGSGGGSGDISGTLTTGRLPKATGAKTLGDSIMSESGGAITIAGALGTDSTGFQFGNSFSSSHIGASYAVDFYTLLAQEQGSFNTTAAARTSTAARFNARAVRSAGANNLTNVAVFADAQNGQVNYAFLGVNGIIENAGPIQEAGNRVFSLAGTGATSSGNTVNVVARQRAAAGDWGLEVRANDVGLTDNCANGRVLQYDDGSGGVTHTGEWDCTSFVAGTALGYTLDLAGGTNSYRLLDTAVTPGTYNFASITVDQQGRITAASTGSPGNVSTAGGSVNSLAKFTTGSAIGDSIVSDNGTTATVAGNLAATGSIFGEAVVRVDNLGQLEFSSTSAGNGTPDLALARLAASSVAVTDGAGTTDADLADVTLRNALAFTSVKTISTGDFVFSSTALLSGAADTGIARGVAGQLVVNDGDGIAVADLRDLLVRSISVSNAGTAFKTVAAGRVEWSSTTLISGASDTGLERSAAGSLVVNDGAGVTVADLRDIGVRTYFAHITAGAAVKATSTGRVEWSSTTLVGGASDLGLERSTAGVLVVNDGAGVATADFRDLIARTVRVDDALTNPDDMSISCTGGTPTKVGGSTHGRISISAAITTPGTCTVTLATVPVAYSCILAIVGPSTTGIVAATESTTGFTFPGATNTNYRYFCGGHI